MNFLSKSVAVLACVALISSCGSSAKPEDVAVNFTKALTEVDFAKAKEFGTDETDKLMDMMDGMMKMAPEQIEKAKAEAKGAKITCEACEEIDANTKECPVTVEVGGKSETKPVSVVQKDGKWLVNMSKEGMGGSSEPSTEPSTMETDTTVVTDTTTTAAH